MHHTLGIGEARGGTVAIGRTNSTASSCRDAVRSIEAGVALAVLNPGGFLGRKAVGRTHRQISTRTIVIRRTQGTGSTIGAIIARGTVALTDASCPRRRGGVGWTHRREIAIATSTEGASEAEGTLAGGIDGTIAEEAWIAEALVLTVGEGWGGRKLWTGSRDLTHTPRICRAGAAAVAITIVATIAGAAYRVCSGAC